MKILGIDTETTGLDPTKDSITEVGLVLFDTEVLAPVRISGFMVKGGFVSEEITRITGITNEVISAYGYEPDAACKAILSLAAQTDYFCAHNAPFDKSFVNALLAKIGTGLVGKPWIDTRTDLPAEAYKKGKSASLKYLCADHGFLYEAHRAVNDVLAMFQLLAMYDVNEVVKRSQIPNVEVRAVVSFDDKHLAKERGYHWKADLKQWRKPLKMDEVQREKNEAGFPVILVEAK